MHPSRQLGWYWGTAFTPALVQQHSELFHAWVGMGVTATDVAGPADPLHARLLEITRARADTQALRELDALAPDLFFSLSDWGPEYTVREAETLIAATQWGARAITGSPTGAAPPSYRYQVPTS